MPNKESLGIPNYGPWYLELTDEQGYLEELAKINYFLESFTYENKIDELNGDEYKIQFINYGRTQLVFVVTVDDDKQYTLLVNQPKTEYGVGKREFDNLNKYNSIDPKAVIKPVGYYEKNGKELYVTPYYYQARCVGIETTDWGMWIPEPDYHFKESDTQERFVINATMLALLIKLFDSKNNKGISKVRLDGGDFMLLKGYEQKELTFDNIIDHIKLIAARDEVNMSLDEYINRLRIELSSTELEDDPIVLGKKLKQPFTKEEIEAGIELGLLLRSDEKEETPKSKRKGQK